MAGQEVADMIVLDIFTNHSHGEQVVASAQDEYPGISVERVDIWGAGVQHALENASIEPNVISISLGSGDLENPYGEPHIGDVYQIGREAKKRLQNNGQLVIFAAGNEDVFGINFWPASVYTLAAGAHDENLRMYWYNTYHPQGVGYWALGQSPGGSLGTSFAAPRVAAGLADAMKRLGIDAPQAITAYERLGYKTIFRDRDIPDGEARVSVLDSNQMQKLTNFAALDTKRMLIEAAYRALLGIQPDQNGIDRYAERNDPIKQLVKDAENDWMFNQDRVPIMQRVLATYKLMFHEHPGTYALSYYTGQVGDELPSWQHLVIALWEAANRAGMTVYHKDELSRFFQYQWQHVGES